MPPYSTMSGVVRVALISVGAVSLALGVVGIFVPVLPTTPFLLLSAACFVRSSDRLHAWLVNHGHLGPYISGITAGTGMPLRSKVVALGTMWLSTTASTAYMIVRFGVGKWTIGFAVGLALVALAVHRYLGYRIPTRKGVPHDRGR